MEFRILGPLEVSVGDGALPLGGAKPRALLTVLLMHANQAVSAERLAVALWGEEASRDAVKTVRVNISRLRRALPDPDALATTPAGYRLRVRPGELDAERFHALVSEGRGALRERRFEDAAGVLRHALALWRGPALAEFALEPFAQAEAARLEEQRLSAIEARVDADLALGRHAELIGELEPLVAAHPTRERPAGHLMLALYRCARQADALHAYQRTRTHLVNELGLEPGPALKELQAAILQHAPSLELASHELNTPTVVGDPSPRRASLPARSARLLGRKRDIEAIIGLLQRLDVRLVTVTGAGGVGKTSVAMDIAHRMVADFADGVAFVDLAPLGDPVGVPDSLLNALGCPREPGATATESLCRVLVLREQLVVVDNLEHLLAAAPLFAELLAGAPGLKLLATSRASLDLHAEHRYPLGPLALPEPIDDTVAIGEAPATALFITRARARDPSFGLTAANAAAIGAICARLDGLPLGIELAAARSRTLSPHEITQRLDRILPSLGSGGRDAPARQRTLRATLDWSYELLTEHERAVLAQLAVFVGGCTLDAAEQVTGASIDVIDGLITNSMVIRRAGADGATRLLMLQPVHEYAAERLLGSVDQPVVDERHSRYYLALAEAARPDLVGPHQRACGRRLDVESENIRRALTRDQRAGNVERVLRLATALEFWWWDRVQWSEGRTWVEDALTASHDGLSRQLRADGLRISASLSARLVDLQHSLERGREALALYRALEDPAGMARCLAVLAMVHRLLRDHAAAETAAAEAVRMGHRADPWTLAVALLAHANIEPDLAAAQRRTDQAASLFEQFHDARALAWLWGNLGAAALAAGDLETAGTLFERALEHLQEIDDPIQSVLTLANHALVAVERQRDATAAAGFREVLAHCRAHGLRRPMRRALVGLAAITARRGDAERAARLLGACAAWSGDPLARVEQRLITTAVEPTRQLYGDLAWEHAHATGQQLSLEDAIGLGIDTASQYAPRAQHPLALPGLTSSRPGAVRGQRSSPQRCGQHGGA